MKVISSRPLLLYSYLATEMLAPFFASFVIMNCIFVLVKIIPFLDTVLEMEIGLGDFIRSFSYLFPNMFLYSIPMSAMMGVIICFTRLSNDSEILAFKACGISIYRIIPPVLLVAAMLAIFTSYFSVKLIPAGENAMKQLMYQLAKDKIDKGIKEDRFTVTMGDLVVYVNKINNKTNEWEDVWVSDMRGQETPIITMASTGKMITEMNKMQVTIILNNGSLHKTLKDQSQIVTFDRYTIHIPLQPPKYKPGHQSTKTMTMTELAELAEHDGPDSRRGKRSLIQYHRRLALPFGCLILALMGLPLGLQAGPGKRSSGIPLGLAFFVVYYIVYIIGKTLAEDTSLPVIMAMWLPNLVFLLITVFFIIRVANEKPLLSKRIGENVSESLSKVGRIFSKR